MANAEERLRILKMVQEGKISPEEGIKLIEALDESAQPTETEGSATPPPDSKGARWLRVRVTDTNTGKVCVNVRLPVGVVNAGIKLGARFSSEVEGLDMDRLMAIVRAGETGQIVDVYDEDDGEQVEVFIE